MSVEARRDDSFGARNRFLTDTPPSLQPQRERTLGGISLSLSAHVAALVIVGVVVSRAPISDSSPSVVSTVPLRFVLPLGGGGSGEGGGNNSPTPVRRAQLVGPEAVALPTVQRGRSERIEDTPEPVQRIAIPDQQVNAGLQETVGSVTAVANPDLTSRGPGSGAGADGTRGTSSGPGSPGPGMGPGSPGPGSGGDGPYPGNGVSWPSLIVEVKPAYTADAMRAKVQGTVWLECVVMPDGTVGRVNVVRSLDNTFGLDQEAIKAAKQWRFRPGMRLGEPVAVLVTIELAFTLR